MRTAEEVKARAANLRASLGGLGHSLKHGQCLDIISKLDGYPDWNTHSANISTNLNRAEQFVDEMLEGEAELSYTKFTQRFEKNISSNSLKERLSETCEKYAKTTATMLTGSSWVV